MDREEWASLPGYVMSPEYLEEFSMCRFQREDAIASLRDLASVDRARIEYLRWQLFQHVPELLDDVRALGGTCPDPRFERAQKRYRRAQQALRGPSEGPSTQR